MEVVLGVDGGNTKTVALVATRDGTVRGVGKAGCSDIYGAASADVALQELACAVGSALAEAGAPAAGVAFAAFSLAGADWPEDFSFLDAELKRRHWGRRRMIVNDALGALRSGSPTYTGVSVVCGTGAAIGARSAPGRIWHTSWWQEPQGSRDLGRQALRAVYRSDLGIDPPTSLTARILDIYRRRRVEDVLHRLTARVRQCPDQLPAVTQALLEEAERGDAAARAILRGHGRSLGDYALAAARRVDLLGEAFPLVLSGGVLRAAGPDLRDAIVARVREASPAVQPVSPSYQPVVGALLLALDEAGVGREPAVLSRLDASLPPNATYAVPP